MSIAKIAHVGCMFSSNPPIIGHNSPETNGDIVKKGFLRKRKTLTERYFVLRAETSPELPARLEYYENEKAFAEFRQPKKQYILKSCFGISKKYDLERVDDVKFPYVISLFIKKESVCLVAKNDAELTEWVKDLIHHHQLANNDTPTRPEDYEHIWQVEIMDKGLATSNNLTGARNIRLTSRSISIYTLDDEPEKIEILLTQIRDCLHLNEFFALQVGRLAITGCGQIWMETEDANIAQSIKLSCKRAMNHLLSRDRTKSFSESPASHTVPQNRRNTMPNRERSISDNARSGSLVSQARWHRPLLNHSMDCQCSQSLFTRQEGSMDVIDSGRMSVSHNVVNSSRGSDETIPGSPSSPNNYLLINPSRDVSSFHERKRLPNCLPKEDEEEDGAYLHMVSNRDEEEDGAYLRMVYKKDEEEDGAYLHMMGESSLTLPLQCHSQQVKDEYVSMNPVDPTFVKSERDITSPASASGLMKFPSGQATTSPTSSIEDSSNYVPITTNTLTTRLSSAPIPVSRHYHRGDNLFEMSPGSGSSSFSSGTPSSDQRLNELGHQADIMFQVNEEDPLPMGRPIRTSSVGSKPEQYKNRFNSAIAQGSAISHSWSGTPGCFYKTAITTRSADGSSQSDYMEVDVDTVQDRKTNKMLAFFKSTKSITKREKKKSEGDVTPRSGIAIPNGMTSDQNYFPLELSHSPRSQNSDGSDGLSSSDNYTQANGYLCMKPGTGRSSDQEHDNYSLSSSYGSKDEYVQIMNNPLATLSSSPLGPPPSTRARKISTTVSPLDSLSSPTDETCLDLSSHSNESDSSRKKEKKSSKRRSLKEKKRLNPLGTHLTNLFTRKSTQTNQVKTPLSPESSTIPKSNHASSSPSSSLTRSRSRESKDGQDNSNATARVGHWSIQEDYTEPEESAIQKINNTSCLTSPIYDKKEESYKVPIDVKRLSGVLEPNAVNDISDVKRNHITISPNESISLMKANQYIGPKESVNINRDENMLSKCSSVSNHINNSYMNMVPSQNIPTSPQRRASAGLFPPSNQSNYINLSQNEVSTHQQRSSIIRHPSCSSNSASPIHLNTNDEQRSYMNVSPGSTLFENISDKQLHETKLSNLDVNINQPSRTISQIPDEQESGAYMLMDGNLRNPPLKVLTLKKPDVPIKLLNTKSICELKLDKLALSDNTPHSSSERSRCHSGPCGNSQSRNCKHESLAEKLGAKEGRASSACSSPVSYSPPTSPTLGSVSSMSSLSEGGLSSASSTCTVVNVGVTRSNQSQSSSSIQNKISQSHLTQNSESISEGAIASVSTTNKDEATLNYASLDLSREGSPYPGSSPHIVKRACVNPSQSSEETHNYSQIDFVKSEGLHTTSLERNSERQ